MKTKFLFLVLILSSELLFWNCAQVAPLTGGKQDTAPPKLLEALPANKSNNFNTHEIILKFDEYIKLKDLNNQLIVTPQLKKIPEVEVLGKQLKIKLLDDILDPGTTYRIDFGNSICDMNEGNVLEKFAYIFSTGPFIDSLKISGNVSSAFNNKSFANALVVLHNANLKTDSTVFKQQPKYFAKADASGYYQLQNIQNGRYYIYAIEDKNKNLLYDGESEQIAVNGNWFDLLLDTTFNLKLFKEESVKTFIKKTNMSAYGFGQIILNKPCKVVLKALNEKQSKQILEDKNGEVKDTISFYYKNVEDTLGLILQNLSIAKTDTLKLVIPKKQIRNGDQKNLYQIKGINQEDAKLNFHQKLRINFFSWMDTSKYDLKNLVFKSATDSSFQANDLKGKWISISCFEFNTNLKDGNNYSLKVNRNAFFDLENKTNDSIKFNFKTQSKKDFGKLILKLKVSRNQNYVVQLLNERELVTQEQSLEYTVFKGGSAVLNFSDLAPGNYSVKIIFDNNANKKWDKGNSISGLFPEPVIISFKQMKIISDWETEEEIILGEK